MKTIPQNTLIPLTELCSLLAQLSPNQEQQPLAIFRQLIQGMDENADYFFDKPWTQEHSYTEATTFSNADFNFIDQHRETEFIDRAYLLSVKKNISVSNGFSAMGFLWTLWTLSSQFTEIKDEKTVQMKTNPSLFATALAHWNPFPYQEKLLSDPSKRIVSCWGRQTGKTTTVAVKALHHAYCNPDTTVLVASPSLRQSMIMFDHITYFTERSYILRQGTARKTQTTIQLLNGSRIVALPCSENLLRGYTADLVICDEAAFMSEEVITRIIFPMLSATDGTAIFLSTPWGKDHFFHKAYTDPNYSVHQVQSTQCPLITAQFLEEQRRNMTQETYRSEYLAEFTETTNSYFPQDLIRTCIDSDLELITDLEQPIPHSEYYAGADFGKLNDHSTIAIIEREANNQLKLIHLHEFPLNTPYTNVIGHITRANQAFNSIQQTLIDQTGLGEPILEELRAQDIPNVEGITFTTQTKEALLTNLKLNMEQKRLQLPYHRRLNEQINQQQYQYAKTGHLTFTHPANTHDDLLWALSLAAHAATKQNTATLRVIP